MTDRNVVRVLTALVCSFGLVADLQLTARAASDSPIDAAAPEKLAEGTKLVKLEAMPSKVELHHPYEYSQLIIMGETDAGLRVDVTRLVKLEKPSDAVAVSPTGFVQPHADGAAELRFSLQGQTVAVPVTVTGQKEPYNVSFVRDVAPAMSKLGCNAGTCHGSAKGKNGFKLSLRGYDPLFDHRALTDDLAGRRFNRAAPDQSLMLLKPSGGVPHVGGVLMKPGQPYYEMLRSWILGGVKLDLDSPRVASIEVFPINPTLPLPGMKQQFRVLAHYTNGVVRDVTGEAFMESSSTEKVEVDKYGLATAERRGEAALLARYEGSYVATTMTVMGDRSGFAWKDVPANTPLDELVYAKLKKIKVQPSELCTDAEFIRRIYLDLTGLPPDAEQVRAFIADPHPTREKRDALIDQLVGSDQFVEHWTNKWSDLLQVNRKFLGEEAAWGLHNWIRQAVATNMPYDQFVHQVLTASGSNVQNPPASYFKVLRDPGSTMENTTQLFLAVRFNCNKCHDHPFERWTQDQYYNLAAYFAQIGRKPSPESAGRTVGGTAVDGALPLVEIVYDSGSGEVKHERTGQVTPPKFPYTYPGMPEAKGSRRDQLADWITSKSNPYFAKSYVNRIWSYMLGVGIIEPVDDIRAGNPPTNPELLDRLTTDFVASNFNVQQLIKTICKSRVYQQALTTNKWNADDDLNYSHALARRLPAETLYDTVHRATGSVAHLPGMPVGTRASQLLDAEVSLSDGFLDLFGRPPRESACECERSTGVMLGQALNLVNGPTIAESISDPSNRITKLATGTMDDRQLVQELFLNLICRPATEKEIAAGVATIQTSTAQTQARAETLAKYEREKLPAAQAAWEASAGGAVWQPLEWHTLTSAGGATLTRQPDGSVLLTGTNPANDTLTLAAKTSLAGITGIRLEVLPDPSLPAQGPGRAMNGNFVLNELTLTATPAKGGAAQPVKLVNAQADFSQASWAVAGAVDGVPASGWVVMPEFGKTHTAVFETEGNVGAAEGSVLTFTLSEQFGQMHTIGRLRISVTTSKRPLQSMGPPANIAAIVAVPAAQRTPAQQTELAAYYRSIDPELKTLAAAVEADKQQPMRARLLAAQDIAWALLNSPAFLFNR